MMIEISFREFYEYRYPNEEFYELYLMKNGLDQVLYIGISNQNIWNRWFGWNGHIMGDERRMIGQSSVGRKVANNLPEAWDWKNQLWTVNDCVDFCKNEISQNRDIYDIKYLEPFIIEKLHPAFNIIYNLEPGKDSTPQSEKEKKEEEILDEAFRKVFENKWKSDKS